MRTCRTFEPKVFPPCAAQFSGTLKLQLMTGVPSDGHDLAAWMRDQQEAQVSGGCTQRTGSSQDEASELKKYLKKNTNKGKKVFKI